MFKRTPLSLVLLSATLSTAFLVYTLSLSAADTDFPIYFENSTLTLKSQTVDRIVYLPLVDIVRHMGLAYTDATGPGIFTIQGQNSRLVLTAGNASVTLNDGPVLLQNPVRRDGGQWLVPLDLLSQGLSRVAGVEFRYTPGDPRAFAGNVAAVELSMSAQTVGPITRLTLRMGTAVEVELQRDSTQNRAVLVLKGKPIDPVRERLDYKDRLVQSITFDDADGTARISVGITSDVRDIRLTATEENRVVVADFIPEAATEAVPAAVAPTAASAAAAIPDARTPAGDIRVIVIDAGHGGIDSGAANAAILEKDLTLALARRLRSELQGRMAATVLLTRDSDVELTSEARSAVANNNQAGLLVSLHTGYSPDGLDSGSSIYVMPPSFTGGLIEEPAGLRLFLPWYMAYRPNLYSSEALALQFQEELKLLLPGWKFPLRTGPIALLASATMPAVAIEIGNMNNAVSVKTISDPAFQSKISATMAGAIDKFVQSRSRGRL